MTALTIGRARSPITVQAEEQVAERPCFRVQIECVDANVQAPVTRLWVDRESYALRQVQTQHTVAGQVTDKDIERETGWTAIRAFTWSIELADLETDCFTPVSADRAFKNGERFRLRTAVASAPQQNVQLVVHGAARFDPRAVIVEKIVLRHR